jgi:hypothetical protein
MSFRHRLPCQFVNPFALFCARVQPFADRRDVCKGEIVDGGM